MEGSRTHLNYYTQLRAGFRTNVLTIILGLVIVQKQKFQL